MGALGLRTRKLETSPAHMASVQWTRAGSGAFTLWLPGPEGKQQHDLSLPKSHPEVSGSTGRCGVKCPVPSPSCVGNPDVSGACPVLKDLQPDPALTRPVSPHPYPRLALGGARHPQHLLGFSTRGSPGTEGSPPNTQHRNEGLRDRWKPVGPWVSS